MYLFNYFTLTVRFISPITPGTIADTRIWCVGAVDICNGTGVQMRVDLDKTRQDLET